MKRAKAARARVPTKAKAELTQLAETVKAAQRLIDSDEAEALVGKNKTCSQMIRASTAQEQLYYVMLGQYGGLAGNKDAHDKLQNQAFVMGDLIMKAFALGIKEGQRERQAS